MTTRAASSSATAAPGHAPAAARAEATARASSAGNNNSSSGMAVNEGDVRALLSFFLRTPDVLSSSRRNDTEVKTAAAKCEALFKKDYRVGKVTNMQGELCMTYPPELLIVEAALGGRMAGKAEAEEEEEEDEEAVLVPPPPPPTEGTKSQPHTPIVIRKARAAALADELMLVSAPDQSLDTSKLNSSLCPPAAALLGDEDVDVATAPMSGSSTAEPMIAAGPGSVAAGATSETSDDAESYNDTAALREYFEHCRFSRVRSRFVVPVILVRSRNICRSSTLSHEAEVFLNMAHAQAKDLFGYGKQLAQDNLTDLNKNSSNSTGSNGFPGALQQFTVPEAPNGKSDKSNVDRLRSHDIALLNKLGVKYICDLMVEYRKIKFGLSVCSSEKADSQGRYNSAGLEVVSIPYPGCEFFKDFRDHKRCGRRLTYDWTLPLVNAPLKVCNELSIDGISWNDYKTWDLVQLTQNYLRLLIRTIELPAVPSTATMVDEHDPVDPAGLLIHCISGWDRTPLFVSLMRISTWADDESHWSLSPLEMLYLTIGYDWMLFSHMLVDRMNRGEEIFQFCFYVLRFLESEEFCLRDDVTTPRPAEVPVAASLLPAPSPAPAKDSIRKSPPGDVSEDARLLSPVHGSQSGGEIFPMDLTAHEISLDSIPPLDDLEDQDALGDLPGRNRAESDLDFSGSLVNVGAEDFREPSAGSKSTSSMVVSSAATTTTTNGGQWKMFGSNQWQSWLAPPSTTPATPPKPMAHQVSRGFVISPSTAAVADFETPVLVGLSPPNGNNNGHRASSSSIPIASRKTIEQELSDQLRDGTATPNELDADAPQNSWQVIGDITGADSVSPPSYMPAIRATGTATKPSHQPTVTTGFWGLSSSPAKAVTPPPPTVTRSAIASLFWKATGTGATTTNATTTGSDAVNGNEKSVSNPETPLKATNSDDLAQTTSTLQRVASFTLIDESLLVTRDRSMSDPHHGGGRHGSFAGASRSDKTFSQCGCCVGDTAAAPAAAAAAAAAAPTSDRDAKLQRRRERLRAVRSLFMSLYLSVQEEIAAQQSSATTTVWDWLGAAGAVARS